MNSTADTSTPMLHQGDFVEEPTNRIKQYIAATSVSIGSFCVGTALAWTSPAFAELAPASNKSSNITKNETNPEEVKFLLTPEECAMIGSAIAIGALVSAVPAGILADKFGRKLAVFSIAVCFLIGWLSIICASAAHTIVIGRLLIGASTGAICVVAPAYIGEIAEPAIRGILSEFFQMGLSLGILTTSVLGLCLQWRYLSGILAVAPTLLGLSFAFMPESPVYLIRVGKHKEAERALKILRGGKIDVTAEFMAIERTVNESHGASIRISEFCTNRGYKRALLAVVGVLAFQQLCGINAVVFYTAPIFESAGSTLAPNLVGVIIALVQVISSYISILIIEKANRKIYLMMSSTGMMLFLVGLALFFHMKRLNYPITHVGFIPIGSAILFMASFCLGYGPIPWMLMGELLAPELRGIGGGIAILVNWTCAFLVTFSFPLISSSIGAYVAFYGLSIIMAGATVFVYFLVPETRGRSLAEIQQVLHK